MRNVRHIRVSTKRVERLESRCLLAADPILTEFMAANRDTLLDGSQPPESSDWIEVYNPGDEPAELAGWYLTDDAEELTKWKFPDSQIPANEFMIVFASGKGVPDSFGNLHANFRLRSEGEFLALVKPDGQTIVSQFGTANEDYPRQAVDVSFGRAMTPFEHTLVASESTAQLLIPNSEVDVGWRGANATFDDSSETSEWFEVQTPIGYGGAAPLRAITNTDVQAQMKAVNSSALLRIPFVVSDSNEFDSMSLRVAHDDGFVAYLNGHEIASQNSPDEVGFQSAATGEHAAIEAAFMVASDRTAVWYSFEDDGGQTVTDKLANDGEQSPVFNSGGSVDSRSSRSAFGERSLRLPGSPGPPEIFNRLRIPETRDLGEQFTLAAHVNFSDNSLQRLFSNYNGTGPVDSERILFDVDPSGESIPGIRLIIGNRGVVQTNSVPAGLDEDRYHHFAVTYDDGDVQIFWDGQVVANGKLGSGPLTMPLDLFLGEDPHDGGGNANEQLTGNVDDVVVLTGDVLSAGDIDRLANEGAHMMFASGGRNAVFETFDVTDHKQHLRSGMNVLAIQAMNVTADDDDFYLAPQLVASVLPENIPSSYFDIPTPGGTNATPLKGLVNDVALSHDRGFYEEPFGVEVSTTTPGAAIVYTTDGSEPTLDSGMIVNPIDEMTPPIAIVDVPTTTNLRARAFKDGYVSSKTITQSYVFLGDVIRQPSRPEGLPNRWGRARADYEMDPEIVDASPYRETIQNDLQAIPSVSLSIANDHFFGPEGIYSNTLSRGREWERPVSVEYWDTKAGEQFHIDAGLRVHGGFSRDPSASPQHSLRLHFRSEYGEGKLRFPLFSDSRVTEFDSLVLNAQSSDNWSSINTITGRAAQFMRDQWAQDMQREMGHEHVPGKYVHVYINGLYWGLYGLMERPDDDFAAAHFGGTDDEYDVIVDENASSGDLTAWRDLLRRVRDKDYRSVTKLLDIDNFIDYMILNIYMGNWDWPDHNWNAIRRRADGEKFKFLVWDAEVGLGLDTNVPGPIRPGVLDVDLAGRRRDVGSADVRNGPGEIYDRLRTIPQFQARFAQRLRLHFSDGGALTPVRASNVYLARANEIESALVGQSARWGDVRRRTPDVPGGVWSDERDWILNVFFAERGEIVLQDFRDENLYDVEGDFNLDGQIDASDIASVCQGIRDNDRTVDLSGDGQVSLDDLRFMIQELIESSVGDANLDGIFNSRDLVHIFQVGSYEDAIVGNSTWTSGDWNCDGEFNSSDLVFSFQNGGYLE